ncbi:MAG: 4-demethylwyosine synthase TYW1 [Nanoarchaeota archaeon]
MLSPSAREELEKQAYRVIGGHSAVKTCGWTKKMVRGEGGCYKLKFYGIMSHQCLQMTTSMSCANRCTFCWRGYKAPVSKEWEWPVDDPQMIFDESIKEHLKLLVGFKGNEKAKHLFEESTHVKHVALSLTGEPIIYPRVNELLTLFNKKGISTFLVTNAQYPDQIRDLAPVTQLYLSLDAPTKEMLKEIDKPLFSDYWERLLKSLDHLAEKRQRTCIRLSMIKDVNMSHLKEYAELINRGKPDFIEIKAYMFVGASRQVLSKSNMPYHEDIVAFSKALMKHLPDYDLVSDHVPSRVVMLARKEYKKKGVWQTWIDFPRWGELVNNGEEFFAADYSCKTPTVGLTGTGTLGKIDKDTGMFVNESTEELEFWKED